MSDSLKMTLGIIESTEPIPGVDMETGEIIEFEPKEPATFDIIQKPTSVPDLTLTDAAVDYEHARNVTYTMLDLIGTAVAGAYEVAKESEHPRAYGVLNELANTMRVLTQDLLAMQKVYKEITKDRPENTPPPTVNNQQNNFYGSTSDILRLMEEQEKLASNG